MVLKNINHLDYWQKEILKAEGNLCVCCGRQTGKSQAVAIMASNYATSNRKKNIIIVSVTEDQSIELLVKIHNYLLQYYPKMICKGMKRPTKSKIELINGSVIRTKAVGQSGISILGFTIDLLIVDEAAKVPESIWEMITPTLLTTAGRLVLISTPFGKNNYFWRAYNDDNFKKFFINSEEVIYNRPISESWTQEQRDKAILYLEAEKKRMSEKEYGQQYLAQFLEDLNQFYLDNYIRKSMITQRQKEHENIENRYFYLGVDISRLGEDHTAFSIVERIGEMLIHRESIVWNKNYLPEIKEKIIKLDEHYHFKKIYLDSGGLGIGVLDELLAIPHLKKRTFGLDNSTKIVEYDIEGDPKTKKLLGVELHFNLLALMEKGKILILDDGNIYQSLKSFQYEYVNEKGGATMRVFASPHKDGDIVESLKRAAWAIKDKINKVWIAGF